MICFIYSSCCFAAGPKEIGGKGDAVDEKHALATVIEMEDQENERNRTCLHPMSAATNLMPPNISST